MREKNSQSAGFSFTSC